MPPGRGPKQASQGSALEKFVAKLCQELNRISETEGEEINGNTVESLCEALRSAKARDTINATAVGSLLAVLENQHGEFCCSIDIKTFCAILYIVLQSEDCREGERILVLLANELFKQSLPQDAETSENLLVNVAKEVDVSRLIEYFVDSSKPSGFRRWVGIIMQQLLKGPEAVSEQFQHTPEDIRPSHMIYFSHSVVVIPPFRFGRSGENVEFVLEGGYILLFKTSTENDLDQILQISCSSIHRVSVSDSSATVDEKEVHDVIIEIKDNSEVSYLDSRPTNLQQLRLTLTSDINVLMDDLRDECPQAEFPEDRFQVSQAEDDILVQGEGSSPETESRSKPSEGNEDQQTNSDPLPYDDEESSPNLNVESEVQAELRQSQPDDTIISQAVGEPEMSQQNRNQKNVANKLNSPENGDVANFSDSPTMHVPQGISPSSDESVESEDEGLELPSGQALLSRQKGKSCSRISRPMPINESLLTNNGTTATHTAATEGKVSRGVPNKRETPMPNTQPSASQAKQSQSSRNTELNGNKLPKKYSLKPKTPIAVSKGQVESTRPTIPAKTTTVPREKDRPAQVTVPAETSVYDLPINEDEQTTAKASQTTKGTKNKVGGSQQKGKTSGKGRGKNAKTYQKPKITPKEDDEHIVAKRGSQRAAASQAMVSMSKINDDLEDIDDEDDLFDVKGSGPAQSNVSRKRKTVEQPAEHAVSEVKYNPLPEPPFEKDEETFNLQQQDAQELGLVGSNFPPEDPFQLDDLYTASPPASKKQQNYSKKQPEGLSRKNAAVNFASQLDGLLSDDANGDSKKNYTDSLKKGLFKKRAPPSGPPPKLGKLTQSISKKKIPDAVTQGAEDNICHHSQDESAQDLQLQEETLAKPEAQKTEKVAPVILSEMKVGENQKVGNTTHLKELSEKKSLAISGENEDEHLILTNQADQVLEIPSHPLSRFSKSSKREVVHEPVTVKESASDLHQSSPESSPPSSPLPHATPIEEKKRKVATEVPQPSKRLRPIATKSSENPPITRPGPRPKIKAFTEISASNNRTLLDDQRIRKTTVIHFSSKGAQNQGSSSTSKPIPEQNSELPLTRSKIAKEKSQDAVQNKRGHDDYDDQDGVDFFASRSPPKKRQSISPPDLASQRIATAFMEYDSGTMAPVGLRSSSQGSRVDAFGSPLAQHTIPSIGQILQAQQRPPAPRIGPLESRTSDFQRNVPAVVSPEIIEDTSEIFGPPVKLVSIAKARPALPGESPVRYVPHTKTQHGTYEGILTMENIQEEKVLPDPFLEDIHRKPNEFAEILRARKTGSKSKADRSSNVRFGDPDKTLVEIEEQQTSRQLSSPSDLTSNSSLRSDDSSNTPTQTLSHHSQWSLAVRPHYEGYADTVHKIADEMIIRLTNEEDASELIVNQYDENATNMLEGLTGERNQEKISIRQQIENKKNELIRMYSEANKTINQTEKDTKTSSIDDFNKEWQERQDVIFREIEVKGGRRTSEG